MGRHDIRRDWRLAYSQIALIFRVSDIARTFLQVDRLLQESERLGAHFWRVLETHVFGIFTAAGIPSRTAGL